jgi:hypothetical protein
MSVQYWYVSFHVQDKLAKSKHVVEVIAHELINTKSGKEGLIVM